MKKMRLDAMQFWLSIYPEEKAVEMAFRTIDETRAKVEDVIGKSLERVETIIYEDREYNRKDYL